MEIRTLNHPEATILELNGKLNLDHVAKLKAAVLDTLESGCRCLVLDLSRVTLVDSSGLGGLVACRISTENRDGKLRLLQPSPKILDVLIITRTDRLFRIYSDKAEAIVSCRDGDSSGKNQSQRIVSDGSNG